MFPREVGQNLQASLATTYSPSNICKRMFHNNTTTRVKGRSYTLQALACYTLEAKGTTFHNLHFVKLQPKHKQFLQHEEEISFIVNTKHKHGCIKLNRCNIYVDIASGVLLDLHVIQHTTCFIHFFLSC